MNSLRVVISIILSVGLCGTSAFARQTVIADPAPLTVDGGLNGVDITGAHTLLVGVAGGTQLDVYTNNPSPYVGVTAIATPASNDQGMVQFNVNSDVFGDIGATTIHVLHSITAGDNTVVNFMGSVYSTALDVGLATVNFKGGAAATNTVAPNFTGDGIIRLAANTIVTGALTTNTDNTGTLILGSGSQWTGAVGGPGASAGLRSIQVAGGSNDAGVSAGITGAVYAHSLSLLTNTLNIVGALTLANNAVIKTTLASASVYGHIIPSGGPATLGTGVNVDVVVPPMAYIPAGTKFNIIQPQNGGSTGAGLTVTDSTNPLYIFSTEATAPGEIQITLVSNPVTTVPLSPDTPLLPSLPALLGTPLTPDIEIILAGINAESNSAGVIRAARQLGPTAAGLEAPLVAFREVQEFQNLWLSHMYACNSTSQPNQDLASCEDRAERGVWWLNGFGSSALQHDRGNSEGYRSNTVGTMLAYDVGVGLQTRAGLGVGYAGSSIHGNSFDGRTDMNTYQATAYAGHDRGPLFIHGSGSFGWNDYSGSRPILFTGVNRTANADYSGQNYTALAKTGYHAPLPQKFTITPSASLQYTRVNIHSYTESGAGDVNLRVASQGYDFLQSGLGAKAERDMSYRGWGVVPDVHGEWLHNLANPTLAQSTSFTAPGAPSFATTGLRSDRNTYRVGTALTVLGCKCSTTQLSLEAGYDYDWTPTGYNAHKGTMRLTNRF